jgi:hypothetical protein
MVDDYKPHKKTFISNKGLKKRWEISIFNAIALDAWI